MAKCFELFPLNQNLPRCSGKVLTGFISFFPSVVFAGFTFHVLKESRGFFVFLPGPEIRLCLSRNSLRNFQPFPFGLAGQHVVHRLIPFFSVPPFSALSPGLIMDLVPSSHGGRFKE